MRGMVTGLLAALALIAPSYAAPARRVVPVATPPKSLTVLPMAVHGRAARAGEGIVRQWPGSYVETAVRGPGVLLRVGPGAVVAITIEPVGGSDAPTSHPVLSLAAAQV